MRSMRIARDGVVGGLGDFWVRLGNFADSFSGHQESALGTTVVQKLGHSGPFKIIKVGPHEKPYWEELGWGRWKNTYIGRYLTRYGIWNGKIDDRAGVFDVFIYDPPLEQLRRHPHWQCFIKCGKGTEYKLHLNQHPKDVSSIVLYMQALLEEAHTL